MEANTCCLCKQPYYRMDALSGTPRRRVVLPVGDSSRAPYRLWPCGHGAHKLCLAAQGEEGTSMNGQCSVPLLPPARRTQKNKPPLVTKSPMKTDDNDPELEEEPEETKQNANHGDEAAPKKMPRLNECARRKHELPPWRRQRTNA